MFKEPARRLSAIAIDQGHEQNNAAVKDDGGAVDLTESCFFEALDGFGAGDC